MKERILEFLRTENKSSAQFAEEIGVQPSGISHILSGRNNPSLDFILKMLEKYKFLSSDWLLFGKGSMYKSGGTQSLFDENDSMNQDVKVSFVDKESPKSKFGDNNIDIAEAQNDLSARNKEQAPIIERIVWFYDDNSFEEYFPRH